MSLVLKYNEYANLLCSGDNKLIKESYQKIFELLTKGYKINPSGKRHFVNMLTTHVASSSQSVRKWAYHCACFYNSDSIFDIIEQQIVEIEKDKETIIWGLTALFVKYPNIDELRTAVGKRHEEFMHTISPNYLIDAACFLGGVSEMEPGLILKSNISSDLAALTKIYTYNDFYLIQGKYPNLTEEHIAEIRFHDDPYVREYAQWALTLGKSKNHYLDDKEDSADDVRKWQIANQICSGDSDFICSAIKPLTICPANISYEIKIGILRGISSINYNSRFVPLIYGWFDREDNIVVLFKLVDYMLKNCFDNRSDETYFEILYELLEDSSYSAYIKDAVQNNKSYKLQIDSVTNRLCYSEEVDKMGSINLNAQTINMRDLNNADGNGQITTSNDSVTDTQTTNIQTLIDNVRAETTNEISEQDRKQIESILESVNKLLEMENKPNKVIQTILKGLEVIPAPEKFKTAAKKLIDFFS